MPNFKVLGLTVSESINFKCEIFGSKMAILGIFGHFQPKLMRFWSKIDPYIGFLRRKNVLAWFQNRPSTFWVIFGHFHDFSLCLGVFFPFPGLSAKVNFDAVRASLT